MPQFVPEDFFSERANEYDREDPSVPQVVDYIIAVGGGGPALEFGIGTGRIALPLSQRGVEVQGIDLSPGMVEVLKVKPGADKIKVAIGDFSTTKVESDFAVVYLVFNTIMNVTTQDAQVACFQNAAYHLRPGGSFVIEVMVPELQRLAPGETFYSYSATPDRVDVDEYDIVNQALISRHYSNREGRWDLRSIPFRYAWPAELDLMARLAGMTLVERWAGWNRASFTSTSRSHVSRWVKPSEPTHPDPTRGPG